MSTIVSRRAPRVLVMLALVVAAGLPAADVLAQQAAGELEDLAFRIVDATTGEPGTVDRIELAYLMVAPEVVVDTRPDGTSFVLRDVPIKPEGRYIITAWKTGVPYFFSLRGRELAGAEQTLEVLDTTTDRTAARIVGMNVVVKHEGELLRLEYLLQVTNDAQPPVTIFDPAGTFGLQLPADATEVAAEFHRGPQPIAVPVQRGGGGARELGVPLVPGINRLRVTASAPWTEDRQLAVGADLPVDAWSVLATPDYMVVDALALEPDPDAVGVKRLVGPALEAGQALRVRLAAGTGQTGPEENVFASEAPAAAADTADTADTAAADADAGGGLPAPLLIAALVLIVIVAAALARRRT